MKLAEIMTYKTAFEQMKHTLQKHGVDVSNVKHITDLGAALCDMLPKDLIAKAEEILSDENALALITALVKAADGGFLTSIMYRPTDAVKEIDLYV